MLEPVFQLFALTMRLTFMLLFGLLVLWFRWMSVNPVVRLPASLAVGVVVTLVCALWSAGNH